MSSSVSFQFNSVFLSSPVSSPPVHHPTSFPLPPLHLHLSFHLSIHSILFCSHLFIFIQFCPHLFPFNLVLSFSLPLLLSILYLIFCYSNFYIYFDFGKHILRPCQVDNGGPCGVVVCTLERLMPRGPVQFRVGAPYTKGETQP